MRNQGTRESLNCGRSSGTTGQVNASTAFFNQTFLNDCQRARFRKDIGRCRSDDLAYSRNDSSRGACRDAPSRANASFADARKA